MWANRKDGVKATLQFKVDPKPLVYSCTIKALAMLLNDFDVQGRMTQVLAH